MLIYENIANKSTLCQPKEEEKQYAICDENTTCIICPNVHSDYICILCFNQCDEKKCPFCRYNYETKRIWLR